MGAYWGNDARRFSLSGEVGTFVEVSTNRNSSFPSFFKEDDPEPSHNIARLAAGLADTGSQLEMPFAAHRWVAVSGVVPDSFAGFNMPETTVGEVSVIGTIEI